MEDGNAAAKVISCPTWAQPEDGLRIGVLHNVARNPAATALVIGTRTWSYAEIDRLARKWAACILDGCGSRPKRVGVFAQRNETAYIGVLAALYAGATFVPLNRKFPVARTQEMIAQADLDAVFVDAGALPQLTAVFAGLSRIPLLLSPETELQGVPFAGVGRAALASMQPLDYLPSVAQDAAAYLLFTSGSTGLPKGVPIRHSNARSFLDFNCRRYGLTQNDRLSQTFDQTFDLSVFDLFMAWEVGAAVCAMQPIELLAPARAIERHGITVWFSVPSVAKHVMRNGHLKPHSLPGLRWSLFCGEAMPRAVAEAWQAAAPNSVLENLYGPTELTIACSVYRWDRVSSPAQCARDLVPIGRVYEHLSVLLVDENLRPIADETAAGELCVAGAQTFDGYWRAPELDQGRFVSHRGSDGVTRRYYCTGDLVQRTSSGDLHFCGRVDQQVKVGGYRVELGEVEASLRGNGCAEAVVLLHQDAQGNEVLVAIVNEPADTTALCEALRRSLPAYMVPAAICGVAEMPLNANGKVDRNMLRTMLERGDIQPWCN